jgi:cyclin B
MAGIFAQGELGARGLRDSRRNDAPRQADLAAKRVPRNKLTENYSENSHQGALGGPDSKARRSPRISSIVTSNKSLGAPRERGISDITNVTAGKAGNADRFKPFAKPSQQPQQQQSFLPPPPAPTREVPAPVPAAPAFEVMLDDKVLSDAQSVKEYAPDIIDGFFSSETRSLPREDYMETQADITGKMRMILIDWLIEVHLKYKLRPETLHLTVNLVDRYLSKKQIHKKRLQLVGVVAMFIATKFEEINPPELHDWVYITDNAYKKEDVLLMECNMLSTLGFHIVVPTAAHFFEHLAVANGCDERHRSCAQYLLELGLLDIRMLQYKPSHVVSAALLLSNELSRRNNTWPESMIHESRQSEQSLRHCAEELRQLWKADRAGAGGQLQAVHKKFSVAQRHSVATSNF